MVDETAPSTTGARLRITVADIAAVPSLRLALVLPGDGAPVRWVHSTELLDVGPYLRGGELVCTVGSALVDEAACATFTAALVQAGAVGICFGVGDAHPAVPPALVAACAERDLALVVAELGVPFIALSEHLAQHRVEAAVTADRAGHLLDLVGDGLARPEVLLPAVLDAGLSSGSLIVSAWLPSTTPPACLASPVLAATATAATYLVTNDQPGDASTLADASTPCGVSRPVGWRELGAAVREARQRLVQSRHQRSGTSSPAPCPSLESVADQLQPVQVQPFVKQLVYPILHTGRPHETDLVATLQDYLRLDGSLVETARTRYLHVNSVRHRLERIKMLTGTDPTTLAGSAVFAIALRIYENSTARPLPQQR